MNRNFLVLVLAAAAAVFVARPVFAEDTDTNTDADTQKAVDDALAQKADAPGHTRTLPTTASDRAKEVAFGKQGEAMRAWRWW